MSFSLIRYSVLFILLVSLCSWGEKVHRKINLASVDLFPQEMHQLKIWAPIMAEHGSDPDRRKKADKTEFVKHFIDLDNYNDFNNTNKIVEDFKAACSIYGKEMVIINGTLPWVTDSTYHALVQDLKSANWEKAALTAADLGHYVGDAFMPLHITANYDGQMSGQTGIHRRFEETMTDRYIDNVQLKTSEIRKIDQVHSYIFGYIYANHSFIGKLLTADRIAYELAGKQYNDIYYESLWKESSLFTVQLLEESAQTLARLIYTAWLEAGKPHIPEKL